MTDERGPHGPGPRDGGPADPDVLGAADLRVEVGLAQGLFMERLELDAEEALAFLSRIAQHSGRPLADICRNVVRMGVLPDDPTGPGAPAPPRGS